jgi:hypothetical protein
MAIIREISMITDASLLDALLGTERFSIKYSVNKFKAKQA